MKKVEIEYKYVLKSKPLLSLVSDLSVIEQFYIHRDDSSSTRIRSVNNRVFTLTHKEGKGRKRFETEVTLAQDAFDVLKRIAFGAIYKNRYTFSLDDAPFVWTLDIYNKKLKGLMLLEAELKKGRRHNSSPIIPLIFINHIIAEVTDDERYTNLFLSVLDNRIELKTMLATWGVKI